MFNDIRLAARQLLSSRAHTLVCLLTFALCIGANTAVFSIVRAVLLQPLPFALADRIVTSRRQLFVPTSACLLPARRASAVDPLSMLRAE